MGRRIEVYVDLASFYSYLAFVELQGVRDILAAHSVEVDYHPVFLGGIMKATGNKPPFANPAKAKYGTYDARRSMKRCGRPEIRFAPDFKDRVMTLLPSRALHFIKRNYPRKTFEATFYYLFYRFWTPPHSNLTQPSVLAKVLAEVPSGFKGPGTGPTSETATPLFGPDEIERIMQATSTQEIKDSLQARTQEALDRGAFGAPWFWVTNSAGRGEPFFGSDRFHFIYKYLDLPFVDITLLPPNEQRDGHESKL